MKRPIHGVVMLLHPAFKEASLFMDTTLLEDRDTYLPKILSCEQHATFLQEFINYNNQRGIALASPIVWKRDSLVKPLFWWESFGYQMPLLQRIAMRVLAQVNVDSLKLSLETLKSVQKESDAEEEQIFRDLYLELEEIDRRVNRTRSHSKVTLRASRNQQRRGHPTSTIAYSRRASDSRSAPSAMEDENEAIEPREPSYDDDGNIISDGDYENVSIMSSSEEDNCTSSDE
ncbi:hypothetical protein KP509_08G011300 [Ceratopteris richardii]|uniref:HAT C-terminal dimerisation domain-containing protein n=1 Tax=Ceratopteris richardii TaxID=49495 RepID=A0A8T2U7R2_CERRI|nr:hypothetical protein KP509_08G011300 [Ceratopteris richardii]